MMWYNQAIHAAKNKHKVTRLYWRDVYPGRYLQSDEFSGAVFMYDKVEDEIIKTKYESTLDDRVSKDWVQISEVF